MTAPARYEAWLTAHQRGRVVYLEIGVGYNTPGIIKFPFMRQVYKNPDVTYTCLNMEEQAVPDQIRDQSILIAGDSDRIIREMAK